MHGGDNTYGQLGNGTSGTATGSLVPEPVLGLTSGVTAVAAGGRFSLAIQHGAVHAWGLNGNVGLGDGTSASHFTPVSVTGLTSGVTAIAAGDLFSLAIQNGVAYAWGWNSAGYLGCGSDNSQLTPVHVSGLTSGVSAIAAGVDHALGIKNGSLYAWGSNFAGQLGIGTSGSNSNSPVPVLNMTSGVTAVAAGYEYSLAVQSGKVYAWGLNSWGQLGDGTTTNESTPELVSGLSNIVEVSADYDTSYALSADGTLWAWGHNLTGDVGVGTKADYLTPQQVSAPSGYKFSSIAGAEGGHDVIATLVSSIPEPASLGIFGLGVVGLLARRRHR